MKIRYVWLFAAMLPLTVAAPSSHVAAQSDTEVFYCPGETKQFIGPDGKFNQVDRQTYQSWPKAKQDAYRAALDKHIKRTDASAKAFTQTAAYARDHALELHRLRLEALNSDPNLFSYRNGEIDLLLKGEGQMSSAERQAYQKAIWEADSRIMRKLAQKNFNAEFCAKRR
jgi:hypothetical protein